MKKYATYEEYLELVPQELKVEVERRIKQNIEATDMEVAEAILKK